MNTIQNNELAKVGNSNNYKMISLLCPTISAIRASDSNDIELLTTIGQVVNIEMVEMNPDKTAETLYWDGVVSWEYSQEQYHEFLKALLKMCVRHPKAVIRERVDIFISAIGLTDDNIMNSDTAYLFDEGFENGIQESTDEYGWKFYKPIFPTARKNVILFLSGKAKDNTDIKWIRIIFYNVLIPIIVLLWAFIDSFMKKKYALSLILLAIAGKMVIIFLTEPIALFFYWLSIYLLGYVYLVYRILCIVTKRKNEGS